MGKYVRFDDVEIYIEVGTCALILGGIAALLTALVIANFKRLISQYHYKSIFHSSVLTTLVYLGFPLLRFLMQFYIDGISDNILVFIAIFLFVSIIVNGIVVTMMSIDYLLVTYYERSSLSFRRIAKWIFAVAYVFAVLVLIGLFMMHFKNVDPLIIAFTVLILLSAIFCLCLFTYIVVLIVYFVQRKRNPELNSKTNVPLIFTGISFLAWTILIVIATPFFATDRHWSKGVFGLMFVTALFYPIVIFIVIIAIDRSFKVSLRQFFKGKCGEWTEDDERTYASLRYRVKDEGMDRLNA